MRIIDEKTEEDLSDVVAYIRDDDALIIRTDKEGAAVMLITSEIYSHAPAAKELVGWGPADAIKLFRKGDRITLEF